jgi:Cu/Ag efflux pump CusA
MQDTERSGFVGRVIEASGRNPWLTILLVTVLAGWGWYALRRGPLDAIPDLSDAQVIVFTEWMGQSPDRVEDQVTYPITTALLSAPKVRYVRGQSMFGMSFIYVIFEDGTDIYWARSRVLEYLSEVQGNLPRGVQPRIGPDASGVGWVFQYALVDESGRHDLAALRSLQDWNLRYALESVPGVAEVATVGGFVKQYQVQLDPNRLLTYGIPVRYAREFRDEPQALLGRILVPTPGGAQVPLSQVARVRFAQGPPMIRSEDGQLVGFVFVDVGDRPLADYVDEARRVVARDVRLPRGVRIEWAGQFTYFERARQRLKLVVPVTLLLIVALLYLNTRSLAETGIVLLAVPFSLIGAFWLLYLLGYNMSVAVWVGLIALAGVDAETGVVMLLYLTLSHSRRRQEGRLNSFGDLKEAIVEGAAQRIRPKLMTVLTDMIGLLPVLVSTGTGADLMKRIAAPLVGGITTSFLLELTVYPAIFAIWKGRELRRGAQGLPAQDLAQPSQLAGSIG